ncbi:MAG: PAS domain S-box protein [Haloarculaceae archaeon]
MQRAGEIRVLHVDDDPKLASRTATNLEHEDERIAVETATSAAEGLEALGAEEFDCVVSEYDLAGRDGIEFLEAVRDRDPTLPFILATADGDEAIASDAISAGVTDYLREGAGTDRSSMLAARIETAVDQRRTRAALEETRRQRAALFESFPEPTVAIETTDKGPRIRAVNAAFEATFGIDEEEALGASVNELIVPEGSRSEARRIDEQARTGAPVDREVRRRTADGPRDFLLRSIPVGGDLDYYGVYEDITERKERERELEALFENALAAIAYTAFEDGEPIVRDVNDAFERTFGVTEDEAVGASLDALVVPDGKESEASAINQQARAGEQFEEEVRRETPDGTREFLLRSVPVDSETGGTRAYAVYQDVTAQREYERKLTALHEVAADLETETSIEAICERTVAASREILAFDLSGIDMAEDGYLRKVALSRDVPPSETTTMSVDEGIAGRTFRTGESLVVDDLADCEDARPQGPYRSALSIPIGDHGVFQAVSADRGAFSAVDRELADLLVSHTESALDRLERERELERTNERLDEFASVVSHDLRNPLQVATGRLELVREECDSESLDAVDRALERMGTLIDELLTLARQGETALAVEPVSLADIVAECWQAGERDHAETDVRTDRRIAADRNRLRQLLDNLFRNALEHGGEDVTVTVGDCPGGFYVADDGPGIPEDERDRVFEIGYTTTANGTGFGLSIAREIAELHGWEVTLAESESGGARFEFTGVEVIDEAR